MLRPYLNVLSTRIISFIVYLEKVLPKNIGFVSRKQSADEHVSFLPIGFELLMSNHKVTSDLLVRVVGNSTDMNHTWDYRLLITDYGVLK
jgi:hypothetical protein